MYRVTGLILMILLLATGQGMGQYRATVPGSQYKELQQVLEKLRAEVEEIPFSVGKVANQEISYDSTRITPKGFRLIEHEIERTFTEQGRVNMLQLEEFEQENVLQITGTDSTLLLRNTAKEPNEKENSLRLLELGQKYGVDAFMKGYVQYRNDVGYVISIELISPTTREVVWSKSLVSNDLEPEEETFKGKLTLITAGVGNTPTGTYLIDQNAYSGDILLLDYNVRLALRQPVNSKNSGYIGVQAGYHYYNTVPVGEELDSYERYTSSMFEVGLVLYKTLAEKSETENAHWVDLFIGPHLLMPAHDENMFALTQGVHVNVAENLGISFDVQYLFSSNPSMSNAGDAAIQKNIELNTIGYGVKVLLRL